MNIHPPLSGIDKRIITFLLSQTTLTIATCSEDKPYCATCFYVYSQEDNCLIFKSSKESQHILNALANNSVAGSVLPDKLVTAQLKGIQFTGTFTDPEGEHLKKLQRIYYKKYPFAIAVPGNIWSIELKGIKYTDNTLGFGKKISWEG